MNSETLIRSRVSIYPLNPDQSDSRDWIESIRRGDREALRLLIERYKKLVFFIVSKMIENRADQEELGQDVFLKIYANISRFRGEAKLSTWIGRIAFHTCASHIKKKKAMLFSDFPEKSERMENICLDPKTPESMAENRERSHELQRALAGLSSQERLIVGLFHGEGMSYQEICSVMKLRKNTVKTRLFRVRKKLREKLHGVGWEENHE